MAELLDKWHVTLIDFRFARAFGPDNLEAVLTKSTINLGSLQDSINDSSRRKRLSDRSVSSIFRRRMSALGNRSFAAPEIIQNVTEWNNVEQSRTISHYVFS